MSNEMREWRVSQSGNANKAWIICAGKKISPLMTLAAAKQLAKLHNTELHYEVLTAYKEQAAIASKPQVTEATRYQDALREARDALEITEHLCEKHGVDTESRGMAKARSAITTINALLGE